MGTFSPSPFYTDDVARKFCEDYVLPGNSGCHEKRRQRFCRNIISWDLLLTPDGPKVLEYNARFGDPEAQVVLPRMKT